MYTNEDLLPIKNFCLFFTHSSRIFVKILCWLKWTQRQAENEAKNHELGINTKAIIREQNAKEQTTGARNILGYRYNFPKRVVVFAPHAPLYSPEPWPYWCRRCIPREYHQFCFRRRRQLIEKHNAHIHIYLGLRRVRHNNQKSSSRHEHNNNNNNIWLLIT